MNKLFFAAFLFFCNHLAFSATADGRWHAGDPTIFGWLTVVVYFAAVARCFVKSKESKFFGGNYKFWLYLAALLFFLGINKQLDLQSWFTEMMRNRAHAYGWYAYRQSVLLGAIGLLGVGILLTMISFRLYLANSWRNYKITWAGLIVLAMLVLFGLFSSKLSDVLTNQDILGLNINAVIEIIAVLLIIIGTYFNKNNIISLTDAITLTIKDYVETAKEGDAVQCPQCGVQPLSKPKDGRTFKCRSCGFHYSIRVVDNVK
jgi:predicted RNA-binding Zn-ribbon protein involved in translation (DUF1610 family)